MPIDVTCTNPDCGASFKAGDEMTGETVECPKCGQPVVVGEAGAEELELEGWMIEDAEAAEEEEAEEEAPLHHPARQQCPNCGAVLGVRAAFCPQCGADIRTGAVTEAQAEEGRSVLVLALMGGGALVALAVVVVLAVLAVKAVTGGPEEPAPPAEQAAEAPAEAVAERGAEPRPDEPDAPEEPPPAAAEPEPEPLLPAALLEGLAEEQEQIREASEQYRQRLRELLERRDGLSPEQMAREWADLYQFCRDSGLESEAEHCWYQAVSLRPSDTAVNEKLGRTETIKGTPVTPAQKEFLLTLEPRIQIVNAHPDFADHLVSVNGGEPKPIPWGRAVEFRPEPGPAEVEVFRSEDPDRAVQSFTVTASAGVVQQVELKSPFAAPALPYEPVQNLYAAIAQGTEPEGVQVYRDSLGNVTSARAGGLSAEGSPEEPLKLWLDRRSNTLGLIGRLAYGDPFGTAGQQVLSGTAVWPLSLAIGPQESGLRMRGGTHFTLRTELSDGLWGVLATAQGDLAAEWARVRLQQELQSVRRENEALEAAGKLEGPWEREARLRAAMDEANGEVAAERRLHDLAGQTADHVDRLRALDVDEPAEHTYMNWPRFRLALSRVLAGSESVIRRRVRATGTSGEEAPQARRRGRPGPSAARSTEEEVTPLRPAPVDLDDAGRLRAEMQVLAILPDDSVLQTVRRLWDRMDAPSRSAAMVALEKVGTPEAVSFLGSVTERAEKIDLLEAAFLSLGAIGTPEALIYCDIPALRPEERTASLAAKVVAGRPDALAEVPRFFKDADSSQKSRFVRLIAQAETPGTTIALVEAVGKVDNLGDARLVAEALVRLGGKSSAAQLARLMGRAGTVYPELLERVPSSEATVLVRRLGEALMEGNQPKVVADLLARTKSEAGLTYLRAAAERKGSVAAIRALVEPGGVEALEALPAASSAVTVSVLKDLRRRWYSVKADGEWAWHAGVEPIAARDFLERVVTRNNDSQVVLAAAVMLREVGQSPDVDALVALASGASVPGAAEAAGGFAPEGYEEPEGRPLVPAGFEFGEGVALYALGLLKECDDGEATEALKQLAGSYEDGRLKAAALTALAESGDEEELEFLRSRAMSRKENYESVGAWVDELETRLAAMKALGHVADLEFLPRVLDVLHENPPPAEAIAGAGDQYDKLVSWYWMTLHRAACDCLARICRRGTPGTLTGDADLQEAIVERVIELIERLGVSESGSVTLRRELRAAAIRALGRTASPDVRAHRLLMNRLVKSLAQSQATSAPSPMSRLLGRRSRGAGPQVDPVRASLLDALTHMVVRGGGGGLEDSLTELVSDDESGAWDAILRGMASYPSPGYFRLVRKHIKQISDATQDAIVQAAAGEEEISGPEYAGCLASILQGEVPEGPVVAEGRGRRSAGPPPGVEQMTGPPEWVFDMISAGPGGGPGGGFGPPADIADQVRQGQAGDAVGAGVTPGAGEYRRVGARRSVEWSYSVERSSPELQQLERQRRLAELLLQTSDQALASALRDADWLRGSRVGPLIALRYAERAPANKGEVIAQLGQTLTAGLVASVEETVGPGFAATEEPEVTVSPEARRAAAIALRRIGGDEAADALYTGLVGPPVSQEEAQPSGRRRPGGGGASPSPVAGYLARALGSMGRVDLLQRALNARTNQFFRADYVTCQVAALDGMAYLPAEDDPVRLLRGLLAKATTSQLQQAASRAISKAVRRLATAQESGGQA